MKKVFNSLKKLPVLLSAFALIAFGSFAYSQGAGLWGNFPIIGGAAYCSSTVNSNCVNTVPAGPAITGNETIPADTNASSLPGTGKLKLTSLGLGPYQYNAPATGATVTVSANSRNLVLNPAGTIATLTVTFPAAVLLVDGQRFGMCTTQIVTSLTVNAGAGSTVNGKPTAMLVPVTTGGGSCPEWLYRASDTTWYRTH